MKANELMIGDWVYSSFTLSKLPCKVTYLKLHESGYDSIETTNVIGVKDIASLSPIPLTPEILEKNEFIKQDFDGWECIHPDDSTFSYTDYRILWRIDYDNHLFIKKYKGSNTSAALQISGINYVHQLQHAIRLCGIDKEITL
jgi:hypothetical protein